MFLPEAIRIAQRAYYMAGTRSFGMQVDDMHGLYHLTVIDTDHDVVQVYEATALHELEARAKRYAEEFDTVYNPSAWMIEQ